MKNKRTIISIENALDSVLNEWKLKLNEATKLIAHNFKFLEANADEYKFLFQDIFVLINQPEESFKAIVNTRINDHKAVEAEKLAKETARIEKVAQEKADAAAEAKLEAEREKIRKDERDKLQAEANIHAEAIKENEAFDAKANKAKMDKFLAARDREVEHDEAIGINAEFDEYKAGQAKQKTTPPAPVHHQKVSASKQASVSQLQKNTAAIEAQSNHKPLPADIMQWSRDYKIDSVAFYELEKLINKHFS